MPTPASIDRDMGSVVGSNVNASNATTRRMDSTTFLPEATSTLSEREQLKIEFYKTYDVMTGVRIAATLGGFFGLMILLLVYKSRCKSSKQLEDPRLTAAAAAAVAEAEAEERALAAALEAISRLPPRPDHGPRRSLCVEVSQSHLPKIGPRFASVGGGYEALLTPPTKQPNLPLPEEQRRCSSVTCSSTGSSYLERRGSAMPVPCLPLHPTLSTKYAAHDEPWDLYYPIDIQVIQPTPELSPCTSEAGLYANEAMITATRAGKRAPLASMGSVDPPEPDSSLNNSRSLGSDSVFLRDDEQEECLDTEDEVSGFSTDSEAPGPSCRRFLRVPSKKKKTVEKWDGCSGCVPRRRPEGKPCQACRSISAAVETSRSQAVSTSTSSQSSPGSPPCSPAIELRHRPPPAPLPTSPPAWSQETLF
ncbi:uncharacterized protein LOC117232476 isoform X2 [Bombus vosnesenskii]|uniref:Uncharacterized protein LOC117232476 isoform X2 n=1 Tax=Bombus vosnesenskii TaxID=207650 RepID=A0A6J3K5E7_9HYME|nr:uncharacterized protein LOC117232476 isoform X2 [Bombus vosnesenskii]XP_050487093.1 uncharacterized protein LOC126871856 isoform X1 [Bombus huntii]XP_050487094.1 uncharacterized protein LOC126871856 isoform X1 [Bombus huntii]XP_050487095.1 uncharacterized protein LOC126871856 isoform X1 [Bombus huntii]XP_050487096.1 uncharacterized protein LOC126871856 isoform X1 [Bombus huntii]XP_050487097.1 uncharacterized protein LOC126871856 isoform X1 [Bombus huntii]XP_050487098.1 uncharacterized prot